MFHLADQMFAWEAGELGYEDYLKLFGALIANGWAWTFQGKYGREAVMLIEDGRINSNGEVQWDQVAELEEVK